MQNDSIWLKRSILFFFLSLIIVFYQFGYIGHYGFDDMQYAEISNSLLKGQIDFEDHFTFRFTIVFLTAISYFVFGVNDFASALPSMAMTALMLAMVYQVLKKQKPVFIFIGLSFCLLSEWFIAYSNKLMPDIYLASFLCMSIYFFWNYKFNGKSQKSNAALMALSLFFAFNSKGTIVLGLPLFLYFLLISLKSKSDRMFWIQSLITIVFLFGLYFLLVEYYSGSFLKRFEAIYSNAYLNRCSYDQQSVTILLKRLFRDLFGLFQREGMLAPFLFLPAVLFTPKKLSEVKFWTYSAMILLLSSNFMTISLSSYNPMCLDARHYLFLSPIGAIAAAKLLPVYFELKKVRILVIFTFALIGCYSFYDDNSAFSLHYLPILIALSISMKFNSNQWLFAILMFIALSIKPYQQIKYAQDVKYFDQAKTIKTIILPEAKDGYLICNRVQSRIIKYYNKFESNDLKILSFPNFNIDTLDPSANIYLFENWHTRGLMFYSQNDLPFYIKNPSSKNEVIFESNAPKMKLTKMNEFIDPENAGQTIYQSKNDFEKSYPHWQQNELHLKKDIARDGEMTILCPEYSSTLVLALDSLLEGSSAYYIKTTVDFWVADKTDASVVISLENEKGSWLYNSQTLENAIVSYSNWTNQSLSSFIKQGEYKNNSTLKVYVYNPSQNTIYLDNFKVLIKEIK